jgi:hypothetical protein
MATLSCRGKTASEESALRANELLLWFSARREGSWHQFRRAVDELHADEAETGAENSREFPLHQQLRLNFECLAHVEFRARGCEDGWRVAPPTLAAQATNDGVRSVLCGARSPALQARVVYAAKNLSCEVLTAEGVPDVFRFTSSDRAGLADVAAQAGMIFQADAPLAILSHLPPCNAPSRDEAPCDFPGGADWIVHQFDAGALIVAQDRPAPRSNYPVRSHTFQYNFPARSLFPSLEGHNLQAATSHRHLCIATAEPPPLSIL